MADHHLNMAYQLHIHFISAPADFHPSLQSHWTDGCLTSPWIFSQPLNLFLRQFSVQTASTHLANSYSSGPTSKASSSRRHSLALQGKTETLCFTVLEQSLSPWIVVTCFYSHCYRWGYTDQRISHYQIMRT